MVCCDGAPTVRMKRPPSNCTLAMFPEFGGLLLGWGEVDYASSYEVFAVDDAGAETPLTQVTDSRGGLDAIYLPQTETPRVRIRFRRSADSQPIYLDWLRILPVECGDNPNRFFAAVAEHLPPRASAALLLE